MKPFSEIYIADGAAPGDDVDVVKDIYVPALQNSNLHKRLTYSFTSQGLVELAEGLEVFIKNNGVIQLIIGSPISEQEERSIKIAEKQSKKDDTFKKLCMIRLDNLFKSINEDSEIVDSHVPKRLDLLTQLIAAEKLKIKFAFKKNTLVDPSDKSIQHTKIAIFHGLNDEKVVWGGSANFSQNAFINSAEEISVYKSWDRESGFHRHANRLISSFEKFWKNDIDEWHSCDVPSKFYTEWKEKHRRAFERVLNPNPNREPTLAPETTPAPEPTSTHPTDEISEQFHLREHQELAIKNWIKNDYSGIVEHATGSGKTITGIYAIKHFFDEVGGSNAIIIVPSTILQDQWMNEIYEHIPDVDLHRIGGRIGSSSWKDNVKSNTTPSRLGKKQIVLGVRQSICKKTFYEQVNIGNHLMVLVDELHTIGAKESSNFLNTIQLKYKLGLSATYERANDYLGTKRIIDYFDKALEPKYGLSEAIADKRLVQYDYELLTVSLNAEEEESWIEQSKKISAEWAKYEANKAKKAMPGKLKMMLIERAKISKKASNKTKKAVDVIKKNYKHDEIQRWLVYCQDLEQLVELQQKLFKEGFICSVYYSDLEEETKKVTLEEFYNKGGILLSIKCLDEGVDIPAADHALILASSSNKREYIQRRGRVLRVDKNNVFKRAKVFDLMTVAQSLKDKYIRSLVRSELTRAFEFSEHARNCSVTQIKIEELLKKYNIDIKDSVYLDKDDISYEDDNIS